MDTSWVRTVPSRAALHRIGKRVAMWKKNVYRAPKNFHDIKKTQPFEGVFPIILNDLKSWWVSMGLCCCFFGGIHVAVTKKPCNIYRESYRTDNQTATVEKSAPSQLPTSPPCRDYRVRPPGSPTFLGPGPMIADSKRAVWNGGLGGGKICPKDSNL